MRTTQELISELRTESQSFEHALLVVLLPNGPGLVPSSMSDEEALKRLDGFLQNSGQPIGFVRFQKNAVDSRLLVEWQDKPDPEPQQALNDLVQSYVDFLERKFGIDPQRQPPPSG